jgi:Pregnancy-associated plasma protein-A/Secretion system C-terminal sorting domain
MNLLSKFFSGIIIFISIQSIAQHNTVYCGFDHFMKMKKNHDPAYNQGLENFYRTWKQNNNERGGGIYTLPVVFHVVYNTDNENLPDSVIMSQLDVLNEDYRRMNEDAVNTRDIFLPFAADTEIEFALATTDPDGNPTTGITHNYTDRTSFVLDFFATENTLDEVKHAETGGVDAWNPEQYINIWICNIGASAFGQIFGLSYPPAGLSNWPNGSSAPDLGDEGVILHYPIVGRNNPFAGDDGVENNNLGRTLTHEMGHYLGLRHTWGDELFTDICSEDDGIDDTPICGSGDQFSCNYDANSCGAGDDGDLPDMLENYMDYTYDACYNMFTNDQASLMRYVVEELRSSLLSGVAIKENVENIIPLDLWPVPANGILNFSMPNNIICQYQITDALGHVVLSGNANNNQIDISELSSGSYLFQLKNSDWVVTKKFICY